MQFLQQNKYIFFYSFVVIIAQINSRIWSKVSWENVIGAYSNVITIGNFRANIDVYRNKIFICDLWINLRKKRKICVLCIFIHNLAHIYDWNVINRKLKIKTHSNKISDRLHSGSFKQMESLCTLSKHTNNFFSHMTERDRMIQTAFVP